VQELELAIGNKQGRSVQLENDPINV
jgi:hypothetical protein